MADRQSRFDRLEKEMCKPDFWDYTVMGYADYFIPEEGDSAGQISAAAVMFEAQEDSYNTDAWARHMMTARGLQ